MHEAETEVHILLNCSAYNAERTETDFDVAIKKCGDIFDRISAGGDLDVGQLFMDCTRPCSITRLLLGGEIRGYQAESDGEAVMDNFGGESIGNWLAYSSNKRDSTTRYLESTRG